MPTGMSLPSFISATTWRPLNSAAGVVPGARVVYLGNVGHYVFVTREAEVLREIRAFLASLEGRKP